MTRVEMMNVIKATMETAEVENKEEILEFCDKQIASFSKSRPSKADEQKIAKYNTIVSAIMSVLTDEPMGVADIVKGVNATSETEYTSGEVVYALNNKVDKSLIEKTVKAKKSYYRLVG